jgi:hypothetical protein
LWHFDGPQVTLSTKTNSFRLQSRQSSRLVQQTANDTSEDDSGFSDSYIEERIRNLDRRPRNLAAQDQLLGVFLAVRSWDVLPDWHLTLWRCSSVLNSLFSTVHLDRNANPWPSSVRRFQDLWMHSTFMPADSDTIDELRNRGWWDEWCEVKVHPDEWPYRPRGAVFAGQPSMLRECKICGVQGGFALGCPGCFQRFRRLVYHPFLPDDTTCHFRDERLQPIRLIECAICYDRFPSGTHFPQRKITDACDHEPNVCTEYLTRSSEENSRAKCGINFTAPSA